MDSEDFLNLLTGLSDQKGIVVNVVDVFDFEDHSLTRLSELLEIKIILAANKLDLLLNKLINVV